MFSEILLFVFGRWLYPKMQSNYDEGVVVGAKRGYERGHREFHEKITSLTNRLHSAREEAAHSVKSANSLRSQLAVIKTERDVAYNSGHRAGMAEGLAAREQVTTVTDVERTVFQRDQYLKLQAKFPLTIPSDPIQAATFVGIQMVLKELRHGWVQGL
jgi:hypothetical protein